jgi:two-component system sensor histidine kinase HydH
MSARTRGQPGLEQLHDDARLGIFHAVVRTRYVAPPIFFGALLAVSVADGAAWRLVALSSIVAFGAAWIVAERVRFRRVGPTPRDLPRNLVMMVAGHGVVAFVTGGLDSPFVFGLLPMTILVSLFSSVRLGRALAAAQIAGVLVMAAARLGGLAPRLVPSPFGGGVQAAHDASRTIAIALVASFLVLMCRRIGLIVRATFEENVERTVAARDEALHGYDEQMRVLTTLTAEIAHELKNPLASVKGLSGLLARDLQGKPAERMTVLRREVDRMQAILEEFLNFSRPLVPLSLERVDLSELSAEVVELHEGSVGERRVTLARSAEPASVECDPRKVKQILVNLLQNAIHASPAGGEIVVEVRRDAEGAEVAVRDRGPGLAPEIAASAFDPGVTTKKDGFGLGLTVARALARQHQGDLALRAAEGGGCEALLRLPRTPRAQEEAA